MKGPKPTIAKPPTQPVERFSEPSLELAALPPAVARLRSRILQSVASGAIDDLLIPIQWNEVPPLFMRGQPQSFDPIAYLKQRSSDGAGREMLRIMRAVFRQPYRVHWRGETQSFEWPAFEVPLEREPVDLMAKWRCVRFADLRERTPQGGLLVHRTAIGIDGTWQYFWPDA